MGFILYKYIEPAFKSIVVTFPIILESMANLRVDEKYLSRSFWNGEMQEACLSYSCLQKILF